ncbi:MAG: hypothetical protein GY765_33965 [bacterium]|nr:hypothetical protein [bacterium]
MKKDKELMDFLDKVRVKNLISQSQLTEEDALSLDWELKTNWWKKNRERFITKITERGKCR